MKDVKINIKAGGIVDVKREGKDKFGFQVYGNTNRGDGAYHQIYVTNCDDYDLMNLIKSLKGILLDRQKEIENYLLEIRK
jgi:hypothetical protein